MVAIIPEEKPERLDAINPEDVKAKLIEALSHPNGKEKTKETIRSLHEGQRIERAKLQQKLLLGSKSAKLLSYFAEGAEIDPANISPRLQLIENPESIESKIFRIATLLWSVPVSQGYGRRMRYLVMDEQNNKLMGIIAIGDPVFNLKERDNWIGWNVHQRHERLAFVLDAYVLGSVQPYSAMLGGKVVASLLSSSEISDNFRNRYAHSRGLISGQVKNPYLVLITTTSALGRSSLYNRLRIPGIVNLEKIGFTEGWGHFHISDELFKEVRGVLRYYGDAYSDNYRFGQGPSWRFRALRQACNLLGIDQTLLHHGIQREIYAMPLAANWRDILLGSQDVPEYPLQSCRAVAAAAIKRWLLPRADRNLEWQTWRRTDTWNLLNQCMMPESQATPKCFRT